MPEGQNDKPSITKDDADPNRLLWGSGAIGTVIGKNPRQAAHLLRKGLIRAEKIGSTWVSTPRKVLDDIFGQAS